MKKTRSVYHHITPVRTGPFRRQDTPGVTHTPIHDEMHGFDVMMLDPDATPEQVAAYLARPPTETFESYVAEMRRQILDELAESGFPPPHRYILVSGDSWSLAPDRMVADPFADHPERGANSRLCLGMAHIYETVPMFSRLWFLTQLANSLSRLEECSVDKRDWAIFHFGRLLELCEHRAFHPSMQVAFKNWRGASMGGRARAEAVKATSELVLTEMRKYVDKGHSIARAADFCAKNGIGASKQANVQLWQRRK